MIGGTVGQRGSQSWLQPPFEAAARPASETDLVVAKAETSLISKEAA